LKMRRFENLKMGKSNFYNSDAENAFSNSQIKK